MKLDYLHEFLAIAEEGSFVKAADRLSCSQVNLTKHIKALEAEFNVSFFMRSSRGVALSEYGTTFEKYAREICKLLDEYQAHAQHSPQAVEKVSQNSLSNRECR